MREIKFRARTLEGEIVYFELHKTGNVYIDDGVFYVGGEPCEVGTEEQYTGLKDSKGVEIYEGDILENSNGTTHFSDDDYSFRLKVTYGVKKGYVGFNIKKIHQKWYKVIGNVYENPELLKEKS